MVYSSTRSILEQFELLPPNQRLKEFIIYTSGIDFGLYFQNKKSVFSFENRTKSNTCHFAGKFSKEISFMMFCKYSLVIS